jgi:hypothetical protein
MLSEFRSAVLKLALNTAPKMGLFQVQETLKTLASVQGGYWWFDEGRYGHGAAASKQVIWISYSERAAGADDLSKIFSQLQARRIELERFLVDTGRGAASRFQIMTEFTTAAVAYQTAQTPATTNWLKVMAHIVQTMVKAEDARLKAMQADQARKVTYGQKQTQADSNAAAIRTARSGCILGNQIACAELQRLGGSTAAAPAPTPMRPPMVQLPPQRPSTAAPDAAHIFCWNLYQGWVAKNPRQAACLTTMDRDWILKFCYDAHGLKRFTIPEAMTRIQMVIDMACKKKGR